MAGAFDHASHTRLIHNLQSKGIPGCIVKWTESFLGGRPISLTIGRKTSEVFSVNPGIPQGSPISPILFLFFNAPLIEDCANSGLRVQVGGFADDVHLMAYIGSTEANCRTLERAHTICLKWAQKDGASFAPTKYELVHLTRSPKKFNMAAVVDLGEHQVSPRTQLKVLGLWIDGKLRWGPHIKETYARMASQSLALTKIATSTWGATLNKARQVYTAVVPPAMSYGAAIWHTPQGLNERKSVGPIVKLVTMQNKWLRSITGAYRATNTRVLEAEAGVAPLDLHLDQVVLRSKNTPRCGETVKQAKAKIRQKLRGKRGRESQPGITPTETKDKWDRKEMEEMKNRAELSQYSGRSMQESRHKTSDTLVKTWTIQKWEKRWEQYLELI